MAFKKNPKVDLKRKYKRVFELGLICSLSLLIFAFKFFPDIESNPIAPVDPQDIITLHDVIATQQQTAPPPPPPDIVIPIPTETDPGDIDIDFASTDLDPNAHVEKTKAPPPHEDKKETEAEPDIFISVEQLPEPIGGLAGIQKRVVYPEIAKRAGIEGRVYVSAIIDKEGNVRNAEVLKGIGAGCDEAALAAIESTKFIPGKQREKPVNVQITIPILFKLQN